MHPLRRALTLGVNTPAAGFLAALPPGAQHEAPPGVGPFTPLAGPSHYHPVDHQHLFWPASPQAQEGVHHSVHGDHIGYRRGGGFA